MHRIADFHKVSFNQFLKDSKENGFTDDETNSEIVKILWEKIKLPARSTNGSAGYDFFLPYPFFLEKGKSITIPTGIRAEIEPGWCLTLMPRSSMGFKYGMKLANTIGLIDSDYFYAKNEGHILVKISAETNLCLSDGDRFIQGIFFPHGLIRADENSTERTGGIGSTGD